MSKSLRTVLTAAAAAVSLACLAGSAMAATPWQAEHPRRAEINARLARQQARIHRAVETGRITRAQAARLHRAGERIRAQEERMAARHGGHITAAEQAKLNREADYIGRQIGR